MNEIKLKQYILCISLIFSAVGTSWGQVVFKDYNNYERAILLSLKRDSLMSSFPSMRLLKQRTSQIKENSTVHMAHLKPGKNKLSGPELMDIRSKAVLLICRYSPTLVQPESVKTGATAMVLSEDGICATNYHVLQPLISLHNALTPLDSIMFVATQEKKYYAITEILSYNVEGDLAFFKIDTRGDKLMPIPLGDDLPEGSNIHAITHPEWHMYYYSRGVVARNVCSNIQNPFTNRVEVTADYAKGSSGGPLFDDYGNLVGMVSTTQSIYYVDYPQTSLQMVVKSIIPVSSIKRLIK